MSHDNRTDLFQIASIAQKKLLDKHRNKPKSIKTQTIKSHLNFNNSCSPTQKAGKQAEDMALKYLKENGLILLKRNLLYKTGEIDLVMRDENIMVFVEVRLRNNKHFGHGLDSISKSKQLKITLTSKIYLQRLAKTFFNNKMPACRFDVVSINKNKIKWIKDAFQSSSY